MPKILICNESISSGGIGTYTLSVAKTFRHRGWDIGFVVTNGPGEYYQAITTQVHSYSNISDMQLGWHKIRKLLKVIEEFNPDILLLNHCSLAHYLLPFIPSRIKPVAVLHNDVQLFYETAALFQTRVFRWIAPTQKLNDTFQNYLPESLRKRIRTIQHGVDQHSFSIAKGTELSRRIVFLGNVGENKGADLLPEIFKRVQLRLPDAQLHVVGNGILKNSIQQKCAQYNIPVTFSGAVSPDSVSDILSGADILLLPTRVEGFGLVIVEAMFCGVVPVVSRLSGITDTIVTDNETGLLVDIDNVEGFSSAIIDLLSNPDRLATMRQAAQKVALEKFTLQRMINDYMGLFAEEDDRPVLPQRSKVGWAFETLMEMAKKKPDGSYRFQKKLTTVKQMLTS